MIGNIVKTLKLMKYAHNLYMYITLMLLFLLLGFCFLLINPSSIGTFVAFIAIALLAPVQCFYDFLFSGLVKSSPLSRPMELSTCNLISGVVTFVSYLLIIAYMLHRYKGIPNTNEELSANVFYSGLAVAVTLIYFSVCFKSFILSTFGYFVGYMAVNISMNADFLPFPLSLTLHQAAIWGIIFVLVGIIISSILRVLVYKKPVSAKAMGSSLRKHMQ